MLSTCHFHFNEGKSGIIFTCQEVLTFSPTDSVIELGKSKKKRSVTMSVDVPVGSVSDTVPLVEGPTKGVQTFMKKVKELKSRIIKKKKLEK